MEDSKWMRFNLTFPNVKEFSLYLGINHGVLERFLRCFPNLEKFYYFANYAGCDEIFALPKMFAPLEHLKPLSVSNEFDVVVGGLVDFPIGSLRGFNKLTEVQLHSTMLTGADHCEVTIEQKEGFQQQQNLVDALPACIELITMKSCCGNGLIPHQLSSLLSHKQTHFPALKKIELEWENFEYPDVPSSLEPFNEPEFSKEQATTLLAECEKIGVEMIMKTLPLRVAGC